MSEGVIQIERVRAELRAARVGRCLEHVETTTSTNDEILKRLDCGAVTDGMVVFAEYQTTGRGRLGRSWHSPRGASLLCSVALVDGCRVHGHRTRRVCGPDLRGCRVHGHRTRRVCGPDLRGSARLGLLAAVAACDAVSTCADVRPKIKWPNDLVTSGRKLGGILIESKNARNGSRVYVLGIGINCLQHCGHLTGTLDDRATSLELESADPIDRTALAIALLRELDLWLADPQTPTGADLRCEWLERAEPMGRPIHLKQGGRCFSGTTVDIDPAAALLVRLDGGELRAFDAATTTVLQQSPMDA